MSALAWWLGALLLKLALIAAAIAVSCFAAFCLYFLVVALRILWDDYVAPRFRRA